MDKAHLKLLILGAIVIVTLAFIVTEYGSRDDSITGFDNDAKTIIEQKDGFADDTSETSDFDKDGLSNDYDKDDDNDMIADTLDAFDEDPSEWSDFDFDGIGAQADTDDDNDGIEDTIDPEPKLTSEEMTEKYLDDIQNCALIDGGTSRLVCYSEFFGRVVENEENNSDALELSFVLSKLGTIDDCHFVSHEIGHAAFEKRPDVLANLTDADGTLCRGGYFHGVLASYFHSVEKNGDPFPSSYKTICNGLIGSSNYQDCIHGLGHGLVHYYDDDLRSSLNSCHDMSFYQNRLCMKGVMMQYTDNILTKKGITENTISSLCNESSLDKLDYQECSMSIGTTVAFHTNHDWKEGKKLCDLINEENTKNLCTYGLELEIRDSEKYEEIPLTIETREKYQPQMVTGTDKIIDIRSPALVSDFQFIPEVGTISFSINKPQYVILYIPSEFITSKNMAVTVNGQIPSELEAKNDVFDEEIAIIRFVAKDAGLVLITPLN